MARNPILAQSAPPHIKSHLVAKDHRINEELVKDSFLATSHPKFIKNLAIKFIQDVLGFENYKKYIAIHYRFNMGDFFNHEFVNITLENETKSENKSENDSENKHIENKNSTSDSHKTYNFRGIDQLTSVELQKVLKNSTYLLDKMVDYFERYPQILQHLNKVIYIAAPRNIKFEYSNGAMYRSFKIFTNDDLQTFLTAFIDNCWVYREYFGDILSTVDKELMINSRIFLRSRPSNWSFNSQGRRYTYHKHKFMQHDRVVFDLFNRR